MNEDKSVGGMLKTERFETSDFYVAVYFKAKGSKLLDARRVGSNNKMIFAFEYAGQDQEVKKFYNKECLVEPLDFSNAIRELRGMTRI